MSPALRKAAAKALFSRKGVRGSFGAAIGEKGVRVSWPGFDGHL